METKRKIELLQRLLEQSEQVRVQDSDDPAFRSWKNTVERTLIRIFGKDSPEYEQFSGLRFFYHASVMSLGHNYSAEHQKAFRDHFQIAITTIKNLIEELEKFSDDNTFLSNVGDKPEIDKVFISHSSSDIQFVEEIIDVLEIIGLSSESIFCSSFEGYGIGLGENFLETLKEELNNNTLVVFVLTDNFYSSPYCLCEMGATWALSKEHIPILVPPFDFNNIEGVIPLTQGFKINEPLKLNLFKEKIESYFNIVAQSSISSWERKRDKIVTRLNGKIANKNIGV